MSTLENGHFGQEPEVDVTDDILLPPVLRNLKPSPQITSAPQKLDENAEKWLKTLPWSYADAVRKPAPKKDESPPPQAPEVAGEPVAEVPEVVGEPEQPLQDKGEESGDVAGEGDSGEDSEEEWNYISGKENRQHNQQQKEELSAEDMESQLNPNAAEFVPVYSAAVEPDIASSPQKGMERSLENISIPSPNDFFKEICKRPSDIGVEYETSVNGDALNNLSTKAVFGDDSVCLNNTEDSLSHSEPLKDTNPFASSQIPNFVQDHFSIPDLCARDNMPQSDNDLKPFSSQSEVEESEICFMSSTDKQPDLISPSEPVNKVSESSANDISGITFGDGLNVEEIIRSKQDSPLLRESPEPGLGSGMENNVDATPEEHPSKMHDFCTIESKTSEVENSSSNLSLAEKVSASHQGPETSVDSDSEQDDVLVCPVKKDRSVIENNKNESEETNVSGLNHKNFGDGEIELESELVYHKDEEDFHIKDEKEVCCFRSTVTDNFVSNQSGISLEKDNVDQLDLVKDALLKSETHIGEDIGHDKNIVEGENSADEIRELNADTESSEFRSNNQSVLDDFQSDKHLENEETFDHKDVEQGVVDLSHNDIREPIDKYSNSASESNVEQHFSGLQEPIFDASSHDKQIENELQPHGEELNTNLPKPIGIEQTSSPIDHILESSSVSNQGEESVTSTEISHVDLMDHEEWSRKMAELDQELRGSTSEQDKKKDSGETTIHTLKDTSHSEIISDDEPDEKLCVKNDVDTYTGNNLVSNDLGNNAFEVNSVPSEVTSYYHGEDPFSIKSVGIKHSEDVSQKEKNVPISFEDVSSSISEKPNEESAIPVEEEVCKKQEVHEELICPMKISPLSTDTKEGDLLENKNELPSYLEDHSQKTSSPNDEDLDIKIHLAICPRKIEPNTEYPEEVKESTIESERFDHILDSGHKNINSDMYDINEVNYTHINSEREEQFLLSKEEDENKSNVEEQMDQLCPLRKYSDEEPIQEQKAIDIEQYSSQDGYTDEMSSSMIDYGEDKNLPEAQSNQLDLVQELQFEVQEKQTEGDNESDSGFEIINASEASTVEMEMMRYQSEKEAGAVNEKLLLDRNEAESFEKPEECVSNEVVSDLISNEILPAKAEEEASIIPKKEEVETESSPNVPDLLERTAQLQLESQENTELVNGTVTPPATPPATPAPGLQEEGTKEGLIAAAVAAAGAATAVAAVATAVSESKVEEKKSPVKKTDAPTPKAAGAVSKTPLKGAATKATSEKAPISKPSTPSSKPSTPSSKPLTKPSSPSTKTASASKTSTLTTAKSSTPTSKVGAAKPAGSKPSTPTGTKAAPSAAKPKPAAATSAAKPPLSKPATSAPATKKPAAPSIAAAKTTSTSSTLKPAPAKPAAAPKPLASKPAPAKPAASAAPTKPAAANKAPATKPAVAKSTPSSTLKPSSPSQRPSSSKSSGVAAAPLKTASAAAKPPAKPAPAKSAPVAKPPASTTGTKQAVKPATKAAPPAPINKKPAAPTAIKKPTPTDKSTKEANNKLTAKTALNKKIVDKKVISKKEVIENEELPSQVAIVTTTNGHISLIENGMPPVEIAEEAN